MVAQHSIFPKAQDERICNHVRRQLMWQTDIQSDEIAVEAKNSTVTLSGRVETCLERREAESAAYAVYGVSSVTNNIRVEPRRARTDQEIAADVAATLRMVICVMEELPSVTVRDGVVTLRGRVRWKFQLTSAERAADAVVGVKRVRNLIEVRPVTGNENRRRIDTAPSSERRVDREPASNCRPLYLLPFAVGS